MFNSYFNFITSAYTNIMSEAQENTSCPIKSEGEENNTSSENKSNQDTREDLVEVECQGGQATVEEKDSGDTKLEQTDEANEINETFEKTDTKSEQTKEEQEEAKEEVKDDEKTDIANTERPEDKTASVGTSTMPTTETPEVSSTRNDEPAPPVKSSIRSTRRSSYQSGSGGGGAGRNYAGGYQNYGLAYLPYKSNFEPSEDARRRADEFLKTLKL